MKRKLISQIIWLIYAPLIVHSQFDGNRGVKFELNLSWQQIQNEARIKNKYIFMDVYASWCTPCKKMDKDVYSNETLGNFMNARFVSVKVQFDSSEKDDGNIKSWYSDAHLISLNYEIDGFPSYLIFSPDGKLVYKDMGFKNVSELIKLAENALDSQNLKLYTQLENYKKGIKNYENMDELAAYCKSIGDGLLAQKIGEDFIANISRNQLLTKEKILFVLTIAKNKKLADSLTAVYQINIFDKLGERELLTKENLIFIDRFSYLISSSEKLFQICYLKPRLVDSVIRFQGWARWLIERVITKEEMEEKLLYDGKPKYPNPDWNSLKLRIAQKYKDVDENLLVTNYKINYYKIVRDSSSYVKAIIEKVDTYWTSSSKKGEEDFDLNNQAWEIFLYSNDKTSLAKALMWSDSAIALCNNSNKPNWMDTKANILYKLKKNKAAIALESEVVALEPNNREFQETLSKMKKKIPTWVHK